MKFRKQATAADTEAMAPKPMKPAKKPKAVKPKLQSRRRTSGNGDAPQKGRQKFVLIVGDEGAILVYLQGRKVIRRLFAASPSADHTGAILELLGSHPKAPLYVLVDLIDQQYVRHSFPPVSSLSLAGLVKRRMQRDFQPEDITGSIRLGRDKVGRKEWQYLLIALSYTPLLQQWVALIVEQPNELRGLFLTPVEGQNYIPALRGAFTNARALPWQLLVSHHKVSGFRQIVLREGKLVFTRITQAIDDAVPAVVAGNIEQEITNTLEYLKRLGLDETTHLEMMVVTSQDVADGLDLQRFKAGQAWAWSPLQVAEQLGLEQAALSADRFGDVVMAAAFAQANKHRLRLMTPYAAKLAQLYTLRMAVRLLSVLGTIGLLCVGAASLLDAFHANATAAQSDRDRVPVEQQIAILRQALSGLDKDISFKSAVTLTYDAYIKNAASPLTIINAIQPHLPAQVRVRKFSWGRDASATGNVATPAPAPAPTPAPVPGGATAPVAATTEPGQAVLLLEVNGDFPTSEALARYVNAFVAQLKKDMPAYDITNEPFPWEKEAPKSIEISFDQLDQKSTIKEGDNQITLTFRGPKPLASAAVAAAPAVPLPAGGTP